MNSLYFNRQESKKIYTDRGLTECNIRMYLYSLATEFDKFVKPKNIIFDFLYSSVVFRHS